MKIVIDAFGGDNAPQVPIESGIYAAENMNIEVIFVGDENKIKDTILKMGENPEAVSIVHAPEVISNNEKPASAVMTKKNSSIVVASRLLREGKADALVTAGNTGAVLASAVTVVGRVKGVRRPALASLMPTAAGGKLLLDCGANTDCRSEDLYNFAVMGSIYMNKVMNIESPQVALLSIGEEQGKGDEVVKDAYEKLSGSTINFIGNKEGRDIMFGTADVFVCDGFAGNIALKSIEGTAKMLSAYIKKMFMKNIRTKLSAVMVKSDLDEFKKSFDYREYGGAPLLGIKLPVVKAHGSSDDKAFIRAIEQAVKWVDAKVTDDIIQILGK